MKGKTALVTGSTSGIGRAVAEALAGAGATVILNGFGEAGEIEAQRAGLAAAHGVDVAYLHADLARPDEIAAMMERAGSDFGGIDILVNNAGIQHVARIVELPPERWDAIIAVNLSALFHTTRAVLPGMESKGWGRIINTASAHGLVASVEKGAYIAAKHGVVGLTKTVALETGGSGVTCNAICPGFVRTPLVEKQFEDRARERGVSVDEVIADMVLAKMPSRAFVTPEQIGGLAVYLCFDSAAQITGTTISIDGGYTAQVGRRPASGGRRAAISPREPAEWRRNGGRARFRPCQRAVDLSMMGLRTIGRRRTGGRNPGPARGPRKASGAVKGATTTRHPQGDRSHEKDSQIRAGHGAGAGGAEASEAVLDTTTNWDVKLSGVSRRDFMGIAKQYGLAATWAGVAGMSGIFSADALAATVNTMYEKKFQKKPKHTLKLGTVFQWKHTKIQRTHIWEFVQDVEEVTDGEIRFDIYPGNSVCAEPVCIQKALQGILDIGTSSTQNASGIVPWLNAIDFPYTFQSAGQLYNFFYHPKSDALLRKVYREKYNMEILWVLCEMRQLYMGAKWKDKPPITKIGDLAGTKNRVTNTQLGRIAMQLMELNPVPVAWVETLDAMKSGLIDGMETWTSATTAFNMAPVVSQYVGIKFIPGTGHQAIRVQTLDKLGSRLSDVIMEAGFKPRWGPCTTTKPVW